MKKIWITGADGHVGTAIINLLDCTKYSICSTDISEVDVTNREQVHHYITGTRPDVIINCAGFTDIAECEQNPEKAYAVNAIGARNLAVEAQNIAAKLIHISTDDVFNDTINRKYNVFDETHPKTVYSKSKYAGEKLVMGLMNRYVIIRSSWVYGIGKDFVDTVLNAIGKQDVLEVATNQVAAPTSAKELAKVIVQFIDNECFGIYHAVCQGQCTRYEFAQEILKCAGKEAAITLKPVEAENGSYTVLDNMMLRIDKLEEPCDWKTALKEYIELTGGVE